MIWLQVRRLGIYFNFSKTFFSKLFPFCTLEIGVEIGAELEAELDETKAEAEILRDIVSAKKKSVSIKIKKTLVLKLKKKYVQILYLKII